MGDPKKQRKKYQGPGHPWQADRISEERELLSEYGLKNKKELWRINSLLRNWRGQARSMISLSDTERVEAQKVIVGKLNKLGLIDKDAQLDNVLALGTRDLLERRLQTLLHKKGLSNTVKQARQFITHNKVMVNGKSTSSPSMLLKTDDKIDFVAGFKPTIQKTVEEKKKPAQEAPVEVAQIEKEVEAVVPEERVEAVV